MSKLINKLISKIDVVLVLSIIAILRDWPPGD